MGYTMNGADSEDTRVKQHPVVETWDGNESAINGEKETPPGIVLAGHVNEKTIKRFGSGPFKDFIKKFELIRPNGGIEPFSRSAGRTSKRSGLRHLDKFRFKNSSCGYVHILDPKSFTNDGELLKSPRVKSLIEELEKAPFKVHDAGPLSGFLSHMNLPHQRVQGLPAVRHVLHLD